MDLIEFTAYDNSEPYTIVVPASEYICLKDSQGSYSVMYLNYVFQTDKENYFKIIDQLKAHIK